MIGVYSHLRNARYLGSITILRRWLDPRGIVIPNFFGWNIKAAICVFFIIVPSSGAVSFTNSIVDEGPWRPADFQGVSWKHARKSIINTLPETNSSPQKIGAPWKTRRFRTWKPPFLGAKMLVRECNHHCRQRFGTVDGSEIPFPTTWDL